MDWRDLVSQRFYASATAHSSEIQYSKRSTISLVDQRKPVRRANRHYDIANWDPRYHPRLVLSSSGYDMSVATSSVLICCSLRPHGLYFPIYQGVKFIKLFTRGSLMCPPRLTRCHRSIIGTNESFKYGWSLGILACKERQSEDYQE